MSQLLLALSSLLQIYTFVLLVRILITWVPNIDPHHPAVQILFRITEPVLEPARRLIPSIGMVDVSPIVVFIVLGIVQDLLRRMAFSM